MKTAFILVLLFNSFFIKAQSTLENEIIKRAIIDQFSRPKDTIFSKSGKIKKVKFRYDVQEIVITNCTVPFYKLDLNMIRYLNENTQTQIDSSILADIALKENAPLRIDSFDISDKIVKVRYIDTATSNRIFSSYGEDGWFNFSQIYGKAESVDISRVAFNEGHTQALVYVTSSRCGLCGSGYYIFYRLINNNWQMVWKKMAWIS